MLVPGSNPAPLLTLLLNVATDPFLSVACPPFPFPFSTVLDILESKLRCENPDARLEAVFPPPPTSGDRSSILLALGLAAGAKCGVARFGLDGAPSVARMPEGERSEDDVAGGGGSNSSVACGDRGEVGRSGTECCRSDPDGVANP